MRILVFSVFIFMFYSSLPSLARDKDIIKKTDQYIEEGRELFNNKDYYGAVEKWTEALKMDPWNKEVKMLIGDALVRIEELTEKVNEGFGLLDAGKVDKAFKTFLYVKDNSNPETLDIYMLLVSGFNMIEQITNKERYDKIIKRGDELFEIRKYDDALRMYYFAPKFNPDGKLVLKRIEEVKLAIKIMEIKEKAIQLFEKDKYLESKTAWNEVLDLDPYDEDAPIYLSKIEFKLRERERLLALAKSYFDNGVSLYKRKQYEGAIDQFENAIAMNYRTEEAKRYIDKIREEMAKQRQLKSEKQAEQIAWYLREGIKYYNLSQYRKSLTFLNEGHKLDPENTQIKEYILMDIIALKRQEEKVVPVTSPFYKLIQDLKRLGRESYDRMNYQESVKYLEEILLIFPFNEYARLNLTKALKKTDPALAREILAEIYMEATKLIQRDKKREAVVKLKLILDVDPGHRKAKNLLKKLEREQEEETRIVTNEDKKKSQGLYSEGLELYKNEKLTDAVRIWKKAVELNPEFVEARVFLSRAETQLRTLEKYRSGRDETSEAVDDELRIKVKKHYLDGINYYMNGLYNEAISEWEEVLKIDPENENARVNIERAKKRLEYGAVKSSS